MRMALFSGGYGGQVGSDTPVIPLGGRNVATMSLKPRDFWVKVATKVATFLGEVATASRLTEEFGSGCIPLKIAKNRFSRSNLS
jgi:hypothetical protein